MNLQENLAGITTSSNFISNSNVKAGDIIAPGAIIFPKRGGAIATNKKRPVRVPIVADSNTMAVMALTEEIQPQVGLWLDQLDLWSLNSGTSVPQVNNKDLYPLAFCVPPVAEQRRIVAKVDELMGICDDLEARLQRTREACLSFAASAVASVA